MTRTALYFSADQIELARKNRTRPPFAAAWQRLSQAGDAPLAEAALNAHRWRFNDDATAGAAAVKALADGLGFEPEYETFIDAAAALCTAAGVFTLTANHPAASALQTAWHDYLTTRVVGMNKWTNDLHAHERVWLALVNAVAGAVLGDMTDFVAGAAVFQDVVENWIRPQGFFAPLVEGERDGGSLQRSLQALEALVLMAELSAHLEGGADLWGFNVRGVSVQTAAAYLIYYYFFPDKWRWDKLDVETTRAQFHQHSPMWEMIAKRAQLRDIGALLEELRPCFNPVAGLTTLTHSVAARRGLFG